MPERTEQTCWAVWIEYHRHDQLSGFSTTSGIPVLRRKGEAFLLARQLTIPGQVATAVKVRVTVEPLEEANDG